MDFLHLYDFWGSCFSFPPQLHTKVQSGKCKLIRVWSPHVEMFSWKEHLEGRMTGNPPRDTGGRWGTMCSKTHSAVRTGEKTQKDIPRHTNHTVRPPMKTHWRRRTRHTHGAVHRWLLGNGKKKGLFLDPVRAMNELFSRKHKYPWVHRRLKDCTCNTCMHTHADQTVYHGVY